MVLLALGFLGPETGGLLSQLGVSLTERGNVQVDHDQMTSMPKVFAAGDMSRGQSLVVWAIAALNILGLLDPTMMMLDSAAITLGALALAAWSSRLGDRVINQVQFGRGYTIGRQHVDRVAHQPMRLGICAGHKRGGVQSRDRRVHGMMGAEDDATLPEPMEAWHLLGRDVVGAQTVDRDHPVGDVPGDHLIGSEAPIGRMVTAKRLASMVLWGPPGCGKTTIARLLALGTDLVFEPLSAVFSGVADLRKIFDAARKRREMGQGTLLFVDEIHRFNRAQQDAFLPVVEDGTVILVGATTENPSFELNGALLSRAQVFVLRRLDDAALEILLVRAEQHLGRIWQRRDHFDHPCGQRGPCQLVLMLGPVLAFQMQIRAVEALVVDRTRHEAKFAPQGELRHKPYFCAAAIERIEIAKQQA